MKKKIWMGILSLALLAGCGGREGGEAPRDSFDRGAMLANWANNIIIPAYATMADKAAALKQASDAFTTAPAAEGLATLRQAWVNASLAWQHVAMFEIGKAESIRLTGFINLYPTNVDAIEKNIADGNYDLAAINTQTRQGLPAIDYLVNGLGANDAEIVAFYTTHSHAGAYKKYLATLTTLVSEQIASVHNDWKNSYKDIFIGNSGSSATSSVNKFVNAYLFYYEKYLRAGKVGIPAGVFSSDPLPKNTEAYYKGDLSKTLLLESLGATQDFFNGKHFEKEQTGPSLAAYLDYLNSIKNGEDLAGLINNQFKASKTAIEMLDSNLARQVASNNTLMRQAYDQLQRNVVLMKVDMMQALDIRINYVDADGD